MIDWIKTKELFGFSDATDLTIKRPKVVCRCDGCGKERVITVRVKSRIVDDHLPWKCPSCVCLGISDKISADMKNNWSDKDYRNNQIQKKRNPDYLALQSKKIIDLWQQDDYRSKLQVGIRKHGFIEKCIKKFDGQFIYNVDSFVDWRHKIEITCIRCDTTFHRKPLQHLTVGYCPICNTSQGQREVADFINSLGFEIIINDRDKIPGVELDISTDKLSVEYHGLYWHSHDAPESAKQKFRHQNKALECIRNNIRLFQFFDYEWIKHKSIIKSMIANAFGLSQPVYARKLQLTKLTNNECREFFNQNHLQGFKPASFIIGLVNGDDIISAMSFSKMKDGYEIARLATKQNIHVVGGPSRLLKYFERTTDLPIYTFADLRYSVGNVYEKLGFKQVNITKPGYFYYCKKSSKYFILSRQQCQKHKLAGLLGSGFDENLSEPQNMFNNGYRRVWTAGNIVFVKKD